MTMSMAQAYPRLVGALDEVRAQWRRQKLLEGVLLALAGVLGVLVALVAADNLFQPGVVGRALLAAVLWGGLIAGLLGLVVRRWMEDRRDDFFAALVEQRHPELRNCLINALQLGRGNQRGFSPDLIEAIVGDADRATDDMEMSDSVDSRPARHAALWALGAVLVLALYVFAFGPRFTNGLARLLLPAADIPPYTQTQIPGKYVQPQDKGAKVPEGKPVEIRARVEGVIPADAQLHRKTAAGSWQTSVMQKEPGKEDTFRFTVAQVSESFEFYITAGDGRSPTFGVQVVKPPRVEKISVTSHPPAYTGQEPRTVADSDGEVAGLAGTKVDFELKASKPLQKAVLTTKEGDVLELQKRGEDAAWGCSFVVWCKDARLVADIGGKLVKASTTYQLRMLDTEGYESNDPLWRGIALVRDQAPAVAIVAPGERLSLNPGSTFDMAVECRDDYGLGAVRLLCRVNGEEKPRELSVFPHDKSPRPEAATKDPYKWNLASGGFKAGDRVEYWAEAVDRNVITGPGRAESRHFTFDVVSAPDVAARLDLNVLDYAKVLEGLLKEQRINRADSAEAKPFDGLVKREVFIRGKTRELAGAMEKDGLPLQTMVQDLEKLAAGLIAEAVGLLESGRDSDREALRADFRARSLPVQDKIIVRLEELLARLQRNEEAKKALRKMEKKDPAAFKAVTATLGEMIKNLHQHLKDQTELAGKFERLPKLTPDAAKEEKLKALNELDEMRKRTEKWTRGSVNELTKMAPGFVDDFNLRKEVNRIFEEVEKAAQRARSEKLDVALEDLGAGLATKMKEDLELWLPDAPDAAKWVLEEPLNKKPQKIPEMPLPKALEDLIGDLLQKADEFDEEADDVTSAWADNLDQAGWGVSDGPMSVFSAKGKTGNDLPNNMELTGRSGEGRRGKSTGQMVGDTSKALQGRKTPARVGNERYEPGQLKQEGQDDPNGATGGGKKAGAGRQGLQGGTPPDQEANIGRLSAKQAGLREKAEQVARKLDTMGVSTTRLNQSIELMKSVEKDFADHRYGDAFRKKKEALQTLRGAFSGVDRSTAAQINKARDLPPQLRNELMQAADEGYPPGYEGLLKSYYKALSTAEK
jgi:hypothetical protein